MSANGIDGAVEILLVEDNPADARLTREVFEGGRLTTHLNVVGDGEEAMAFLRREGAVRGQPAAEARAARPEPSPQGRPRGPAGAQVRPALCRIPVIVLTTSAAEADILHSYDLQANCFITKPLDLDEFFEVVRVDRGLLAHDRAPARPD